MRSNHSPEQVAEMFCELPERWWIAGGWAIDLFLGEQTREHEDVDVAILRKSEAAFRTHLQDWEIWPGLGDGELEARPISLQEDLSASRDVLWCRLTTTSEWAFELLLNETVNEEWVFKRNDNIRKPIKLLGLVSDDGIPYLRPEVVLLFKAKNNRDKDQHDFERVVPMLDAISKDWLRNSLQTVHPHHLWLEVL